MATQTQHFSLTKPDWEDRASISVLNANTDIIDAQMYDNEQSAANAIGNMAAEYDDTATYEVGDFCIYSEVLYKCVTAVSVAEAFDSTKWTQTKAAENFGSGGGGGSSTLAGLTDVDLTSPTDGQALVYDGANGKWTNGGVVGEGGSSIYSEKQLYKATSNTFQDIVVSWNWADYDAYIFAVHDIHLTASTKQNGDTTYLTKEQIENVIADGTKQFFYRASNYATYTFSDVEITAQANTGDFFITEIIGLRFGTLSPIIYSEEEREVGVWTDGKPLYQKSWLINLPASMSANASVKFTEASIPNLDAVANVEWSIYYYNRYIGNPVNIFWYSQAQIGFSDQAADGVVFFFGGSYYANQKILYTCRYTKTTDTAGSGTWTTTGEFAHHYSTTEHIIGTWTDGKPLYERTVKVAANSSGVITLWTDSSVVIQEYNGKFIIRDNLSTLSLWSRIADSTNKAALMGVGNNTTYGVYADTEIGSSRTNKLDLELTVQYTKTTD